MTFIIDSDDLAEAVVISCEHNVTPEVAIPSVIAKNGSYWCPDVRKLCAGCGEAVRRLTRPWDVAVICEQCRPVCIRKAPRS